MIDFIYSTDWAVLNWIRDNLTGPFMDFIMPKITALGDFGAIWMIAGIVLLCTKKYRKHGIILFVALLIGVLLGSAVLKNLVERLRPCHVDTSVQLLIPVPQDYSFPSGHTLTSVAAATVMIMANRRFAVGAVPLAALIAFSRMYLYVHFPSDVLAGAVLGVCVAFASAAAVERVLSYIIKLRTNDKSDGKNRENSLE